MSGNAQLEGQSQQNRPRILHVITNYAGVGGAEMMLSRLVQSRPDCEHVIVSLMNISDVYQPSLDQTMHHTALNWNGLNTPLVLVKLRKIIKKFKPNAIQGWMYHANVMTSLSLLSLPQQQRPKFYWGVHHSLASPQEESLSTKIALQLSRMLSHQPNGIVYCANASLQQHQAFGFNNANQQVIPNGVALENFAARHDINHPLVVGFAGRCHPAKGYQYLFETISLLKNHPIVFKIAGKGANLDNPEVAGYFRQYGLYASKVELLDQLSDMPSFYQSLDLFLMTSITEGFPNVLVEAMATGTPCVTTDVGDAGFIVNDTGYVVPARDVQQLKQAIESYFDLPYQDKLMLKAQARARVENNFSLSHVSQQYLATWQQ